MGLRQVAGASRLDAAGTIRHHSGMRHGSGDRDRLKATFESAADLYERARPDYPTALLDHVIAVTGIRPGDRLVEVGAATGKATRPFAERGFDITCVEIGPELGAMARRNLADFPDVRVINESFESWSPPTGRKYALVFAATSWHWIDPAVRYRRAFDLLDSGAHLAFWSARHVFPVGGDPFFREIQPVYEEIGEGLPAGAGWPKPGELADERSDIEGTGLFSVVSIRHFDWEVTYDADGYIALLDTFSGHIAMEPWQRERLYGEIRTRLAARASSTLRRHWGAVLHVAARES